MASFHHVSHVASPNFDAITIDQSVGGVRVAAYHSSNVITTQLRWQNIPCPKAIQGHFNNNMFPGLSQQAQARRQKTLDLTSQSI
ncbi:hypothetical protein N7520_004969 [Penicillium odoratum]|uniref:uncharacterized protein n=1 Tax=Penicillium odoratum TaxID=1167516 RepID=UPI0025497A99|nr:uncharacterized protein N7520_004969 [Penicillium odoratum]KAJ5765410.1 hypothetical protein N7520_004969 [Penicillium odoratum]